MSTTINKPRTFQGPKAKYIKFNGKNVVLDTQVLNDWDSIKTLTIDEVHYDHSRNAETGDLTGPAFDRLEIVDYTTREMLIDEAKFEGEIAQVKATYTLSSADVTKMAAAL